ncbi:hypothetical protein BH11PLA2_BH11PLA2_06260 [soil metagenome]
MRSGATFAAVVLVTFTSLVRAELPSLLEPPARLGAARPAEDVEQPIRPVSLTVPEDGPRIVPDNVAEAGTRSTPPLPSRAWDGHPVDDFMNSKSPLTRKQHSDRKSKDDRTSGKFGDGLKDMLDPQKPKEWLFSDHGFDCFASPISNPFLFEDPRALTEIRPLFIYQKIPGNQPLYQGGNVWFLGARGSIAFTEKISLTLDKLGAIAINPGSGSAYNSDYGFAEFWLGPKYTFYRDTQSGTIAAGGLIFQIPTGSAATFQNTGNLGLTPYVSVGKTLNEFSIGSLNGIATTGYTFATSNQRNEYWYLSGHLDLDIGNHHKFYPVMEFNYFQYGRGGQTNFSGVGQDLVNFGTKNPNSASLVTGALGARFKITEAAQIGGVFELPLLGNRDINQYRFMFDLILRY